MPIILYLSWSVFKAFVHYIQMYKGNHSVPVITVLYIRGYNVWKCIQFISSMADMRFMTDM